MFEIHINYTLIIKLKKNYVRTAVFRSSYFSRIVKMWSGLQLPVHQSISLKVWGVRYYLAARSD